MELIWCQHWLWFLLLALGSSALAFPGNRVLWSPDSWIWRPVLLVGGVVLCEMPEATVAAGPFLELPVEEMSPQEPAPQQRRHPRDLSVRVRNWGSLFMIFFSTGPAGGPWQKFGLAVDTGSHLTWVPHVSICPTGKICPYGSYDEAKSETIEFLYDPETFSIDYLNATGAEGEWVSEEIHLAGNAGIPDVPIGISFEPAPPGSHLTPVLGMGPASPGDDSHPIFPQALKESGVIESVAYSMWMPPNGEKGSGSLLFGAMDTSKFSGRLAIVNTYESDLFIQVDGITEKQAKKRLDTPHFRAVVDSGSPTVVPQSLFDQLLPYFPGAVMVGNGWYDVPCPGPGLSGDTFAFEFDNTEDFTIEIDRNHFILEYSPDKCGLHLMPEWGEAPFILGTAFFKAAYLIFDLANEKMGIGQAASNPGPANIIPFKSDGAPIPSLGIEVCTEEKFKGECTKHTGESGDCIALPSELRSKIQSARTISPFSNCDIVKKVEDTENGPRCSDMGLEGINFTGYDSLPGGTPFDNANIEGFVCNDWE